MLSRFAIASLFLLVACKGDLTPIIKQASGQNPADIQGAIDDFKADLGGSDNGTGPTAAEDGFRQITWDGVPADTVEPNFMPGDFFNGDAEPNARGLVVTEPDAEAQSSEDLFLVAAVAADGTGIAADFGSFNPAYTQSFEVFSSERMLAYTDEEDVIFDVVFFLPSDETKEASVKGFGLVFVDVDLEDTTRIQLLDKRDNIIADVAAPAFAGDAGYSFLGISFAEGAPIARARITVGTTSIVKGLDESATVDVVVMDDFIMGEPQKR